MQRRSKSTSDIIKILLKRWKIIFLITILISLITALFNFFIIKPQYETTTKLFIGKEESAAKDYDNSDVIMYQKLMKTYAEIIETKDLVTEALKGYALDLNVNKVLDNLTIVPVGSTQILQIKYRDNDPKIAVDVCRRLTNTLVDKSSQFVKNSNIKIVESVHYPEQPISPNINKNILLSIVVALGIGIGFSILLEYLNNTFKGVDDIELFFDIPVIGIIPKEKEFE